MVSEMNGEVSKTRGKQGLVVLLALAIIIAFFYWSTRDQNHHDTKSLASPRIVSPTLSISAQSPTTLIITKNQKDFHGIDGCNIADINGQHFDKRMPLRSGSVIGLGGWLVDKLSAAVPDKAWIILAGARNIPTYQIPITFRERRPDVQEALGGDDSYAYAGFIININTASLPTGEYHVYIVFDHDGTYYTCDNGRQLLIYDGNGLTP